MATRILKESLKVISLLGSATSRQQSNFLCSSGAAAATALHMPFHSCSRSCDNSALPEIVSKELEYERSEMNPEDSALRNAPEGWKLEHRKNRTDMMLSKMLGGEKVVIKLNILSSDPFEGAVDENNDTGAGAPIEFTVDSIKGNTGLRFDCEYTEDEELDPIVTAVSLVSNVDQEPTMAELEPNEYTGPHYNELDDSLKREFQEYIAQRGVNADLGQYLCRLTYDKEQEEYVSWLEKLNSFVAK